MSFAFPPSKFATGQILDTQEWNEQLSAFASEIDGNLNEHNFSYTTGPACYTGGLCAESVGVRAFRQAVAVDPLTATLTDLEAIPQTSSWREIAGSTKPFGVPGGLALVIISFQVRNNTVTSKSSGLNFCIVLDGAPQKDTLIGSGDTGNDYLDSNAAGVSEIDLASGPSRKGRDVPLVATGLFRVTPGRHSVSLAARNLYTRADTIAQYISNIETIVLHMWA